MQEKRRRKTSLVPRLSSSGHIRGEKRGHGRKTWTREKNMDMGGGGGADG